MKAEPVEDTNVVDLMEALKNSLKHKGRAVAAANTNHKVAKKRAHR